MTYVAISVVVLVVLVVRSAVQDLEDGHMQS